MRQAPVAALSRGRARALLITMVRTDDGVELAAHDYFTAMGGYLTSPAAVNGLSPPGPPAPAAA